MSDQEILELFSQVEEPRTTPEVANRLDISKPATWKRLSDLYERGLLVKHASSGLHGEAWSLSEDGRAHLDEEFVAEEA